MAEQKDDDLSSTPNATDTGPPAGTETAEMSDRPLSAGEIALCMPIFKNSIDYVRVKVHHSQYWWFFGLQDKNTAVTPNGEIFLPPPIFEEDFSQLAGSDQMLFIHEMVHVWQYQLGYGVKARRIQFWNPLPYNYALDPANTLADFNMEAQGNLIADYFSLAVLVAPELVHEPAHSGSLPLYQQVLQGFLANPGDKNLLPRPDL